MASKGAFAQQAFAEQAFWVVYRELWTPADLPSSDWTVVPVPPPDGPWMPFVNVNDIWTKVGPP